MIFLYFGTVTGSVFMEAKRLTVLNSAEQSAPPTFLEIQALTQ